MGILEGPAFKAVTIMDGMFPSIYPWDEENGLSSITSASLTPITKACKTYSEARFILDGVTKSIAFARVDEMVRQMAHFWPNVHDIYEVVDYRLGIRAMPHSRSDARLPGITYVSQRVIRIRAGKIDAALYAVEQVRHAQVMVAGLGAMYTQL